MSNEEYGDGDHSADGLDRKAVWLRAHHYDKLLNHGYITEEEREEASKWGFINIEDADGEDVTLMPDMREAPESVRSVALELGDRLGQGGFH